MIQRLQVAFVVGNTRINIGCVSKDVELGVLIRRQMSFMFDFGDFTRWIPVKSSEFEFAFIHDEGGCFGVSATLQVTSSKSGEIGHGVKM